MQVVLGPAPNPVKVYGALGDQARYFSIADGQVSRLYGETPLPDFPARSDGPRVGMLGGSSIRDGTPNLHPSREVPGRLADRLGVEVVNLGSPGLDSHDLVEMVESLDGVDFSALVVYTGHNDLGNALFESRYGDLPSALYAHVHGGLSHLQLFSQLSRVVVPPTGTLRRTRPGMRPEEGEVQPLDPMKRAILFAAFEKNLTRIAWRTARRGWPLVLVSPVSDLTTMPQVGDCTAGDCPEDWFAEARDRAPTDPDGAVALLRSMRDNDLACLRAPSAIEDAVRRVAADFDHITLVEPFEVLSRDPSFDIPNRRLFIDPVHFSPEGHRELARVLEEPVRAALVER